MNSPAFDTHHAVKMLEKAGAEEPLAEAVVATIGVAVTASVASKADVKELGRELSGRMDGFDGRMDGLDGRMDGVEREMGSLRKDLTERMDGIDGRMDGLDGRMDGLDGRMDGLNGRMDGLNGRIYGVEREMGDIRKDMKIIEQRTTIRLGLMMLGGFSLLAALIKL